MVIEPRPKAKPDAPRAAAQTADRPCFCPHVYYVGCPPLCLHCPFANREGVPTISEHGRKATFLRTITVYHRWKGTARSQRMKKPRFQEAKIVEVRGTPHRRSGGWGFTPPLGPGHLGVANVYCTQYTICNGNQDSCNENEPISERSRSTRTSGEPLCRTQNQS